MHFLMQKNYRFILMTLSTSRIFGMCVYFDKKIAYYRRRQTPAGLKSFQAATKYQITSNKQQSQLATK